MSSSIGHQVKVTLFGQSHSEGIGVVIDGLPAGEAIDLAQVRAFMERRAPGRNAHSTTRREGDVPRILSGLVDGKTCGAPLCCVIENTDTRSQDYERMRNLPRPGHADYTAYVKYNGHNDIRGGGHFSARLTAPLCFAGAVCLQILARRGITVGAHIASIYNISDTPFDPVAITPEQLAEVTSKPFPVVDDTAGERMRKAIEQAKLQQNSLGGVVECAAVGLPIGLGEPIFDGLESRLAMAAFGIPAVKGVEFGAGFGAATLTGAENNDPFYQAEDGSVKTRTNHHGGALGGISSGMPLLMRVAFKPTPSIGREQQTVNLAEGGEDTLTIHGRHDPCVVPRAVPCVEAAVAITLLDLLLWGGR